MDHFDMTVIDELTEDAIPLPELPSISSIATSVVSGIAATAASTVVINLIYQNTDTDEYRLRDHAKLYIGTYVIGLLVADQARKHVARKVRPTMKKLEDWLWVEDEEAALWKVVDIPKSDDTAQDSPTEQ